eukprot:Ihof_evm2s265 gene=Ihof_evmTU2s265
MRPGFTLFGLMALTAFLPLLAVAMEKNEKADLAAEVREMFNHTYWAYMNNAYPADELKPLSCKGRVRGKEKENRGDLDLAMGGYVLGDFDEFMRAVHLITNEARFDNDLVVSVFEVSIRVLGGLLSAHILAEEVKKKNWAPNQPPYTGGLLKHATDLGDRLVVAFSSPTGIPYLRVNLAKGNIVGDDENTCTACAGSMILEYATLSRLTGKPIYETKARQAMDILFKSRERNTDLVGRLINSKNGNTSFDGGMGAGIDSYYEYLFKAYVLLNDPHYLNMFAVHYNGLMKYSKQGAYYRAVNTKYPQLLAVPFSDSLGAFWPGLQVLMGDLPNALEYHQYLLDLTRRNHHFVPEEYGRDMVARSQDHFLRPEFIESTYMLYKATGSSIYLETGKAALRALQDKSWVKCGYAALSNITNGTKIDRMDSFFLAETVKYLYLLFEEPANIALNMDDYIFTTEAHMLPLSIGLLPGGSTPPTPIERSAVQLDTTATWRIDVCPNHKISDWVFTKHVLYNMYVQPSPDKCEYQPELEINRRDIMAGRIHWNETNTLKFLENVGVWIHLKENDATSMYVDGLAVGDEAKRIGHSIYKWIVNNHNAHAKQETEAKIRKVDIYSSFSGRARFEGVASSFGPDIATVKQPLTGHLALPNSRDGCKISPSVNMTGMIAIVQRGTCSFVDKVRNLQNAGAIAVIVY